MVTISQLEVTSRLIQSLDAIFTHDIKEMSVEGLIELLNLTQHDATSQQQYLRSDLLR